MDKINNSKEDQNLQDQNNELHVYTEQTVKIYCECREPMDELIKVYMNYCIPVIIIKLKELNFKGDKEKEAKLNFYDACFLFLESVVGKSILNVRENDIMNQLIINGKQISLDRKRRKRKLIKKNLLKMSLYKEYNGERKYSDEQIVMTFKKCIKPIEEFIIMHEDRFLRKIIDTLWGNDEIITLDGRSRSDEDATQIYIKSCYRFLHSVVNRDFNYKDFPSFYNWFEEICINEARNHSKTFNKRGPSKIKLTSIDIERIQKIFDEIQKQEIKLKEEKYNLGDIMQDVIESITQNNILPENKLEAMRKAFTKLDGKCRSILHAYYYDEFSQKEIAKKRGTTDKTIKQQIDRCRKYFKEKYVYYLSRIF